MFSFVSLRRDSRHILSIYGIGLLFGRIALAGIFLRSGIEKILFYTETQSYWIGHNAPAMILPIVIMFELASAMSILLGWKTRSASILLAGFSLVTAVVFHFDIAADMVSPLFIENLVIACGLLVLCVSGPGLMTITKYPHTKYVFS
ncbi:DoxX family protein [Hyphococcus formosus]|uniref:DoxX family protein n=1 Tax=Hyphococcus formosus TaxID=3143534 RepID=UPI00398A5EE8